MGSAGYTFTDGVPGSDDPLVHRRLTAPLACDESSMSEYGTKDNVVRVASIVDEAKYNEFFPLKNDFFTYTNFLKAVGKFPHFCNEVNDDYTGLKTNAENIDQACKRELATLFAHIAYESGKMDPWDSNPQYK
jgi:chitodextrinase